MKRNDQPFVGWPGCKHVRLAAVLAGAGLLWFVLIYGGADWITRQRVMRVPVHLAAELRIPFVPDAIVVYVSLHGLFALTPFVLRTRRELLALAVSCNLAVLLAGIGFLLVPADLAYPPPPELGTFPALFSFADRLNLTHNLVPSLHVAFAVLIAAAVGTRGGTAERCLLAIWAAAIAVSTILTHQHHVIDVITGALLGVAVFRRVYRPRAMTRVDSLASCESAADEFVGRP